MPFHHQFRFGSLSGSVIPIEQEDGSTVYENKVYEFREVADSDAGKAILEALTEIQCRQRFRLPFEKVMVYSSGHDSISISFASDGKPLELVMLSGSSTMYDLGSNQTFQVGKDAFAPLSAIAAQYCTLREE